MRTPTAVILPLLFVPSCVVPGHEAVRAMQLEADAAGLAAIACTTHNGAIAIRGDAAAQKITVQAELRARGWTEAEAEANVARLRVELVREGDALVIKGIVPADAEDEFDATFAYRISAPAALVQRLVSHNGSLEIRDMSGDVGATTHNGRIEVRTAAKNVAVESHNGAVVVELLGTGPVAGKVATHNGAIRLELGQRAAVVEASTGNGGIDAHGDFAVQQRGEDAVRLQQGEGGGTLQVETHNGRIVVR